MPSRGKPWRACFCPSIGSLRSSTDCRSLSPRAPACRIDALFHAQQCCTIVVHNSHAGGVCGGSTSQRLAEYAGHDSKDGPHAGQPRRGAPSAGVHHLRRCLVRDGRREESATPQALALQHRAHGRTEAIIPRQGQVQTGCSPTRRSRGLPRLVLQTMEQLGSAIVRPPPPPLYRHHCT